MHYDKENFAITFNVLNALDQIWYFKTNFSMAFQVVNYIMPKRNKINRSVMIRFLRGAIIAIVIGFLTKAI